MDRAELLQHFDTLAETPEAVAKLRDLVFQLAVRGLLAPQNDQDESGTELSERILNEKRRLTRECVIKKTPVLEPITSNTCPFEIPKNWAWAYLNDFGDWGSGSTPNRTNHEFYDGTIPWLKSGELNDGIVSESEEKVTELALEKCSLRLNKPGDVLFAMYGATVGKVAILGIEATTNQAVCACTCFSGVFNRYLFVLLKAFKQQFISESAGAAQPNFSKDKIIRTNAPLPPLAEQRRIVAKVEELLVLCDELEARQTAAREHRTRLVRSALDHLTTAKDESEFKKHSTFCLQHSELLFDSVPALRQAIHSLAVQGHLAPQNLKDKPVETHLSEIAKAKAKLVSKGVVRRVVEFPEVGSDAAPYRVPVNWKWVRIGVVGMTQTGSTPPTAEHEFFGDFIPFVKPADLTDREINYQGEGLSKSGIEKSTLIPANSVLMVCIGGSIGKTNLNTRDVCCNQQINALTPFADTDSRYIMVCMKSSWFQEKVKEDAGQTTLPIISKGKWEQLPFPLPPLAEQQRIVAKVDELLRWCDALEARLTAARTTATHLLDATLHQILTA